MDGPIPGQWYGNALRFRKLISASGENGAAGQLGSLISYFSEYINLGKAYSKEEYVVRFLNAVNIQLFGYLGGVTLLEQARGRNPFRDHLMASKSLFYKDIKSFSETVSAWRVEGDTIIVNPRLGRDFCFKSGGRSLEFIQLMKSLDRYLFSREASATSRSMMLERASAFFGTYPGERRYGLNVDRHNRSFWKPEDTAELIRESLSDENSISLVMRVLDRTRKDRSVKVVNAELKAGGRGAGDLSRITYMKNEKVRYLNGLPVMMGYTLTVEKVSELGEREGSIPVRRIAAVENFIELNAQILRTEIPFKLTPKFYVLEGPLQVERSVVSDPLIVLEFAEFPMTLIPIEAWTMSDKEMLERIGALGMGVAEHYHEFIFEKAGGSPLGPEESFRILRHSTKPE